MNASLKRYLIIVLIAIVFLAILLKLLSPLLLQNHIRKSVQEFINSNYEAQQEVSIKKVNLKVLNLVLLKPTLLIKELKIGKKAIFVDTEAELNLAKLFTKKVLFFKNLKVNLAELIISRDYRFFGENSFNSRIKEDKSTIQKIFFQKINFTKFDIVVTHPAFHRRKFEFRNSSLVLNDLALPDNSKTKQTMFSFKADIKNLNDDGSVKLDGTIDYDVNSSQFIYNANGKALNLDLNNLIVLMTGKKHALEGQVDIQDIKLQASSGKTLDLSENLNLNSKLELKNASSFLQEYIRPMQFKTNLALDLDSILNKSHELSAQNQIDSKLTNFTSDLSIKNKIFYLSNTRLKNTQPPQTQINTIHKKKREKKKSLFSRFKSLF